MSIHAIFSSRSGLFWAISGLIVLGLAYGAYSALRRPPAASEGPPAVSLEVPFTPQAPQADWREPWQNACEETSIIMATSFYADENLTPEKAKEQILEVFKVKEESFGESKDESMERIAEIIHLADLGWDARVSVSPELNAIKEELAAGRPVIAPVDVRLLEGAPYDDTFDYHVLVISGYDDAAEEFIVQDPGISGGKDNRYGYENFYQAINDYLPNDSPSGRKAVLFTSPR